MRVQSIYARYEMGAFVDPGCFRQGTYPDHDAYVAEESPLMDNSRLTTGLVALSILGFIHSLPMNR